MAAFLPSIVEPKPNPTPNKSHKGKNFVGLIFLFLISFSKKSINSGFKIVFKAF